MTIFLFKHAKSFFIIIVYLFSTGFVYADSKEEKTYYIEMITSAFADCNYEKKSCFIYSQKEKLTLQAKYYYRKKAELHEKIGYVLGSAGLALPLILVNPNIFAKEKLEKTAVMVTARELVEKIPLRNSEATFTYNGKFLGKFYTDTEGSLALPVDKSGLYEFKLFNTSTQTSIHKKLLYK